MEIPVVWAVAKGRNYCDCAGRCRRDGLHWPAGCVAGIASILMALLANVITGVVAGTVILGLVTVIQRLFKRADHQV